ncbi:MAG: serine hydrolase [Polyangiaceae bacterium]
MALEDKTKPAPKPESAWLEAAFMRAAERDLELRMKLEQRTPKAFALPAPLTPPAPEVRYGSEREAGIKAGATQRLRQAANAWAKDDPNGFVVLVARRGVIFYHEGFNGLRKDAGFWPASIGKTLAGLLFGRAVDQKLVELDQPVSSVMPDWAYPATSRVTFRHCFTHVSGLRGHRSFGGLFNAYLDSALLSQDAAFAEPLQHSIYNGDAYNLAGLGLELLTGRPVWRLMHEHLQLPFGEKATQYDLGAGSSYTALYLAKVGQMLLQDGAYGGHRFFSKGFLPTLWPRKVVESAPELDDRKIEAGIGIDFQVDPSGPREKGVLGPNVVGHGAASGATFRVAPEQQLVIVVGRSGNKDWSANERNASKFVAAVAAELAP